MYSHERPGTESQSGTIPVLHPILVYLKCHFSKDAGIGYSPPDLPRLITDEVIISVCEFTLDSSSLFRVLVILFAGQPGYRNWTDQL